MISTENLQIAIVLLSAAMFAAESFLLVLDEKSRKKRIQSL